MKVLVGFILSRTNNLTATRFLIGTLYVFIFFASNIVLAGNAWASNGGAAGIFDIPPGDVNALIEAIDDAKTNPPAIINLAPDSIYTIFDHHNELEGFNGLPTITSQITINGNGSTIERDEDSPPFRIFYLFSVGDLTLNNLTVKGGFAGSSSQEDEKNGGTILNRGRVNINDSAIVDSTAPNNGGGIYNLGELTVNRTTIAGNVAGGTDGVEGLGGGVYNTGNAEIHKSIISGNSVEGLSSSGGGIFNNGVLLVENSTVMDNTTFSLGGGIYNSGELTVENSTISGNRAEGTASSGGGIYNTIEELKLINSTISGNSTDGGLNGGGGGVTNDGGGTTTIIHSTITKNSANSTTDNGGGGIRAVSGKTFVKNSIIAGNTSLHLGPDCLTPADPLIDPTIISQGHNIFGDLGETVDDGSPACRIGDPQASDVIGEDPLLEDLQDNGGDSKTHALVSGSLAIDRIPLENCKIDEITRLEFDQRGTPRPLDGDRDGESLCDVGAFELSSVCGDLNGNGLVEVIDVVLNLGIVVGLVLPDFIRPLLGDLDGDGGASIFDAIIGLKHLASAQDIAECGPP